MLGSNERDGEHLVMAVNEIRRSMTLQVVNTYNKGGGFRVVSNHVVLMTLETHEYLTDGVMLIDTFL